MKWIKNIFKKEKKEEETPEVENKETVEVKTGIICDACECEIFGEQKSVSKGGKRYHVKPCWRNLQKMAKNEAFG